MATIAKTTRESCLVETGSFSRKKASRIIITGYKVVRMQVRLKFNKY